jgi:hypothetical protein
MLTRVTFLPTRSQISRRTSASLFSGVKATGIRACCRGGDEPGVGGGVIGAGLGTLSTVGAGFALTLAGLALFALAVPKVPEPQLAPA